MTRAGGNGGQQPASQPVDLVIGIVCHVVRQEWMDDGRISLLEPRGQAWDKKEG